MRVLLWHGWLLEGSGSNVYTARVAEVLRADGHDVALLCQEPHGDRYAWIDATGTVGAEAVTALTPTDAAAAAPGRCVLLRPDIGRLLPVFVVDEYEGFEVKRFVDLADAELEAYLDANAAALRAAAAWHDSDVVITGHAIPGSVVALRALGPGRYATKIHGSDLEYAIRHDPRYLALAREGLPAGRAVTGSSDDVLRRCAELVPEIAPIARTVSPGVDVSLFRPRPRAEALLEAAGRLEADPARAAGRPDEIDALVADALARRDGAALDELAGRYDQEAPDEGAAERLRELARRTGPLVGYFGKLIPQKGVADLLVGAASSRRRPNVAVVGFGSQREWLQALSVALAEGDEAALDWLRSTGSVDVAPSTPAPGLDVSFTGRLDHRYAPGALAAMDVLVVPSVLDEAFGMVSAEGAAAGALPLVARHSGLAEVAAALEAEVGRPGLFSFTPGPGAAGAIADGLDRLIDLDVKERSELGDAMHAFVARTWSWRATAERLLAAASGSDRTA
jgi:glycosyltransferase involved in cell wall biosynthesis